MKIIDKYIIRNFIGTFIFMVLILSTIAVIVDLSQKLGRINDSGSTAYSALTEFYPYWSIWIINTFLPIAVFISVIYFTSRLTMQTEIVGVLSGGISFYRFTLPYVWVAIFLAVSALVVGNIVLPWANIKKNKYEYVHMLSNSKKEEYYKRQRIGSQISPKEYVFVDSYDRTEKLGSSFVYQKFDSTELKKQIIASSFNWNDKDSTYALMSVYTRDINKDKTEKLNYEANTNLKLPASPDEILPEEYVAETMNTFELNEFIQKQKAKGSANVNTYENELNNRLSGPFSTIILTLLALSLSSKKRRGGIGINLAVGISLAFVYIFFSQTTSTFSEKGYVSPLVASWIPNIVFGLLTLFLYFRRARS
ncbi:MULTISPECIES: LptF/LptG family permease [unclassified Empedobacter]|uniref:LptF/LptG family permease n=1 Tax=unclassified Empedobacter TaxID=2643773 RepID=UPI0025C670AD|nr:MULTISPECIES: LptF/LptG family permease [unclassified Empedobacter]